MAVYYLRKVLNPFMLKCGALIAGAITFGSLVHTANVVANMPALSDIAGVSRFSYYAFANTEFVVQTIIITLLFVAAWLIKDIIRTVMPRPRIPDLYIHAQ